LIRVAALFKKRFHHFLNNAFLGDPMIQVEIRCPERPVSS
jgi:hypothetical protein